MTFPAPPTTTHSQTRMTRVRTCCMYDTNTHHKKKEQDEREQRNNSWISELTWKLIDQKASARRRRDS
jgi:hypothetical protein